MWESLQICEKPYIPFGVCIGDPDGCKLPSTMHHIPYTIYCTSYTIYHIPFTIYCTSYTIYHIRALKPSTQLQADSLCMGGVEDGQHAGTKGGLRSHVVGPERPHKHKDPTKNDRRILIWYIVYSI